MEIAMPTSYAAIATASQQTLLQMTGTPYANFGVADRKYTVGVDGVVGDLWGAL
jgi:hypothetical protein